MTHVPAASLSRFPGLALGAALAFAAASCHDTSSPAPAPAAPSPTRAVHRFLYDNTTKAYTVEGATVTDTAVQRDLNGSLCARCHADAVDEVKASVHYTTAAPTERVWFPGGGAHGMLDRACGLPATTGLTNHFSDVNLGECAKCHVGRYQPMMQGMFAGMFQQMGLPDAAGQAERLVDAGIDCLICHAGAYRSVPQLPAGGRLAAVAGAADTDARSPTSVGAARSARDNGDFDHDGRPDPVLDTDGDGVADAPLMFDSNGDGVPDTPFPTVAQDRSLEALASIGPTTEHACLRCHEHARTGYKRGTMFLEGHDVHASLDTGPFAGKPNRCTVCHAAHGHKFARGHNVGGDMAAADYPPPAPGTLPPANDPTDVGCTHCHDMENDAALRSVHVREHVAKIACEACHIPYGSGITYSLFGHGGQVTFGRNAAGKDTKLVVADMYIAGDRADVDADFAAYRTDPVLVWFDGGTSFLAQSLAVRGMTNAKVTPFKPMANGMVFDGRFFAGAVAQNGVGAPYNAHSMYRFFANGSNAEVFAGLGMIGMTPTAVRSITLADFLSPSKDAQAMALMQIFPNMVYFDKGAFGYEHYLTKGGSPFDQDHDGIVDAGTAFQFDMLAAANSGLRQFAAFNAPMGLPAGYEWYPAYTQPADVISMKLPDGSEIKMYLQMQANQLPEPQRSERLAAIANYPSFSQVTLGGHGVVPKGRTLGAHGCRECHGPGGVLTRPVPVGRKVPFAMGGMGTVELPTYQWKFYNLHRLVDLGLRVQCEEIVAGTADVDIDGDPRYLRESPLTFVVNWFQPSMPGGYRRADAEEALAGTELTATDLTWNGGEWMPVLEPVTDMVPSWQVLGLPSSVIWR